MSRTTCKAVRLLRLMALLREAPRTAKELADLCGVTTATIWRDLLALQGEPLYLPLVKTEGDRWAMMEVS